MSVNPRRSLPGLHVLLVLLSGCSDVSVTAVDVARIGVTPAAPTIMAGETTQLTATLEDERGNQLKGRSVAWTTTDPAVVAVAGDGRVTGVAPGVAAVRATAEGRIGETTVTVMVRPVATVQITPGAASLIVGRTIQLAATPLDGQGAPLPDRPVVWSVESEAIASVDGAGVVHGVRPGVTRVFATSEERRGEATITVSPRPVASVSVEPSTLALIEGDSARLSATMRADDGALLTGRAVTWSSGDLGVAQVDATGRVQAASAGTTTVTAWSEGVSGQARIVVSPKAVAMVTVDPALASMTVGGALQLRAVLSAADGSLLSGRTVMWSSSDAAVATVDAGGVTHAVAPGTATVSATVDGVGGAATVIVAAPPVPVATVMVVPSTLSMRPGDVATLAAEVRAADGTQLTGRAISWGTSNTGVAGVDPSGRVTAVASGTALITATVEGVTGTASVTVATAPEPVASVTVVPSALSLEAGAVATLTAEARAATGTLLTARPTTWSTSHAAVATVDATGRVTAVADGNATITATVEGVAGAATVTVTTPPTAVATVTVVPSTLSLKTGDVATLRTEARAADGTLVTDRPTIWSTSATNVATINATGQVTAVGTGTATITATVGGVTATAPVDVAAARVPVAAVTVQPTSSVIYVGDVVKLQAQPHAADGTALSGRALTWSSDDTDVATVDAQGQVRGDDVGSVTITATSEGVRGTATVTVQRRVATVRIRPGFSIIRQGATLQYQIELGASDGTLLTDREVTWTTSDAAVATIDANGKLTASSRGFVTVTATCEGQTDTATVWILPNG